MKYFFHMNFKPSKWNFPPKWVEQGHCQNMQAFLRKILSCLEGKAATQLCNLSIYILLVHWDHSLLARHCHLCHTQIFNVRFSDRYCGCATDRRMTDSSTQGEEGVRKWGVFENIQSVQALHVKTKEHLCFIKLLWWLE